MELTPYERPARVGRILVKFDEDRTFPKTRLVSGRALEKAAKSPLFPLNPRLLSQKLKFWENLDSEI
jgi:hypothetical protein